MAETQQPTFQQLQSDITAARESVRYNGAFSNKGLVKSDLDAENYAQAQREPQVRAMAQQRENEAAIRLKELEQQSSQLYPNGAPPEVAPQAAAPTPEPSVPKEVVQPEVAAPTPAPVAASAEVSKEQQKLLDNYIAAEERAAVLEDGFVDNDLRVAAIRARAEYIKSFAEGDREEARRIADNTDLKDFRKEFESFQGRVGGSKSEAEVQLASSPASPAQADDVAAAATPKSPATEVTQDKASQVEKREAFLKATQEMGKNGLDSADDEKAAYLATLPEESRVGFTNKMLNGVTQEMDGEQAIAQARKNLEELEGNAPASNGNLADAKSPEIQPAPVPSAPVPSAPAPVAPAPAQEDAVSKSLADPAAREFDPVTKDTATGDKPQQAKNDKDEAKDSAPAERANKDKLASDLKTFDDGIASNDLAKAKEMYGEIKLNEEQLKNQDKLFLSGAGKEQLFRMYAEQMKVKGDKLSEQDLAELKPKAADIVSQNMVIDHKGRIDDIAAVNPQQLNKDRDLIAQQQAEEQDRTAAR